MAAATQSSVFGAAIPAGCWFAKATSLGATVGLVPAVPVLGTAAVVGGVIYIMKGPPSGSSGGAACPVPSSVGVSSEGG